MTKIEILLLSRQTIFSIDDLAVIWSIPDRKRLWEIVKYYLRTSKLRKLYSGVYSLYNQDFSELELAVNLFSPSYISFHTALGIHGINFQHYSEIHVIALASKKITVEGKQFVYHQFKRKVFFNGLGIEKKEGYQIASLERAVCDSLYLLPSMTLDYLGMLNVEKLQKVAGVYENQSLSKRVVKIIKELKNA